MHQEKAMTTKVTVTGGMEKGPMKVEVHEELGFNDGHRHGLMRARYLIQQDLGMPAPEAAAEALAAQRELKTLEWVLLENVPTSAIRARAEELKKMMPVHEAVLEAYATGRNYKPLKEKCSVCNEEYFYPVGLHHTEAECLANRSYRKPDPNLKGWLFRSPDGLAHRHQPGGRVTLCELYTHTGGPEPMNAEVGDPHCPKCEAKS
jgi:hypothetical protein